MARKPKPLSERKRQPLPSDPIAKAAEKKRRFKLYLVRWRKQKREQRIRETIFAVKQKRAAPAPIPQDYQPSEPTAQQRAQQRAHAQMCDEREQKQRAHHAAYMAAWRASRKAERSEPEAERRARLAVNAKRQADYRARKRRAANLDLISEL